MEEMDYEVVQIPLAEIFADPAFNCRGNINALDVIELARDIQDKGLLSPIIIQPYTNPAKPQYKYRIVAGHRRHKACMVSEMRTMPCFIREHLTELDARFINLNENIKRQDLNIMQEAKAIEYFFLIGMTETDIATKLNCTRGWTQIRGMCLKLQPEFQKEIELGNINQVQIRDLYTIKKNGGSFDEMVSFVHKVKNTKMGKGGTKREVNVRTTRPDSKRKRNLTECLEIQSMIRDVFGNGLATRAIAWTLGEISDIEMLTTIKETADKVGVKFEIPESQTIVRTKVEYKNDTDIV